MPWVTETFEAVIDWPRTGTAVAAATALAVAAAVSWGRTPLSDRAAGHRGDVGGRLDLDPGDGDPADVDGQRDEPAEARQGRPRSGAG